MFASALHSPHPSRAAAVAFLCAALHAAPAQRPALDSAQLIADIAALAADSMEGRRLGTAGGARARAYVTRAFARVGLVPRADSFPWPSGVTGATGAERQGVNVLSELSGTKYPHRYVVVSAHYDHIGIRDNTIYNGADDNASGTAGVLALAHWFKAHPPENSIIFALFDGEESGELGSKAFVAKPSVPIEAIIANVNLDMVGRNAKGELYAAGATPWPVMKPLLDSIVAVAPVHLRLGHDDGIGQNNWIHQSDQGAFHDARIPFVYFGVEDHPDYHKPTDKLNGIQAGFCYRSVQTVAEFVGRLDAALDRVAAVRTARTP